LDALLPVVGRKLPPRVRRFFAATAMIETMTGGIRLVCRGAQHWRDAAMALRWTGAAMQEAAKVRTSVVNGTFDDDHAAAERWARRPFRRAA
jgi:hypothetical protein